MTLRIEATPSDSGDALDVTAGICVNITADSTEHDENVYLTLNVTHEGIIADLFDADGNCVATIGDDFDGWAKRLVQDAARLAEPPTRPGDRGHASIEPALDDVFDDLRRNGENIEDDLAALATRVRSAADRAWDMIGGPSDLEDAYHRGRAHAYCEVLGDQEKLVTLGVFDRPHA